MILFLYGQDSYRSRRKLEEIRAKFERDIDPSGLNATVFDGADFREARKAAMTPPFLVKLRLVILKNALKTAKKSELKELADFFTAVPEQTILVIYEISSSDELAGNAAFEKLRGTKHYPEFAPLPARQLMQWIKDEAAARGAAFEQSVLERYSSFAGQDLWKIEAEIDKLCAFSLAAGAPIGDEAVLFLTETKSEADIFAFLDAVGTKRLDRATELLEALLEQGETEIILLNRLQSHFRNLLVASELSASGRASKEALSRELGIHPFAASKALAQARYYRFEELKSHYAWLVDADEKLKTGGWPRSRMALDCFLLRAASPALEVT